MSEYMEDFTAAKTILSTLNSGPVGILVYAWANAAKTITHTATGTHFTYCRPYHDKNSALPCVPYFAVVRTDRTGIDVAAPPCGKQDLLFDLEGQSCKVELAKHAQQAAFLQKRLGIKFVPTDDVQFVARLLSDQRVKNLKLESAFAAAVHETKEEHGWDYDLNREKIIAQFETDEMLFAKRSFITNPPTPVSQKLFVVGVSDVEYVIPVRTDKVETKEGMEIGRPFFEQGDFMSFEDLKRSVKAAGKQLETNTALSPMANIDFQAALSRLVMVERIQQRITDEHAWRPA